MKKVLISIFTLIFIISMIITVNAASGSISLTASANQVVKGNTFTVTVAGTADENITGLQAALSYDTTKLSLEDRTPVTGFGDISGETEIAITSNTDSSLTKSGTLYTLTFKVLDTAEEGDTTISVTSATLALVNDSQTQENVSVADGSATVTIKADTTTADKNNTEETEKEEVTKTPSSTNNDSSKSSSSSNSSASSSKKTTLPQTGVEVVSVIIMAALSIFAVISYALYKKYKNI